MGHVVTEMQRAKALQQPEWSDPSQVQRVREILASRPPLVRVHDIRKLRSLLAHVAAGEAHVVQAGDCAEAPEECTAEHVRRKSAVLDLLAATLKMATHKPVLRVGRIAGQFAKPRSNSVEQVGDLTLPVYRGHMVNGPEPDPASRRPDPLRILTGYMAASDIMEKLGWSGPAVHTLPYIEPLVWTSHEALLLDYEIPMVRELGDGKRWLGSTHWPWIGERTRQPDGAHVDLLAELLNPVACKVGPSMSTEEIITLCERLDPLREPGRLTLIARMGADVVADRLPVLVEAVRSAGHPVIWLSDPMHGNTVTAPNGNKTRLLETMVREIRGFQHAVAVAGGVAGGLHLETTPDDVTECIPDASALSSVGDKHTSFCDPRLNPRQAVSVVSAWSIPSERRWPTFSVTSLERSRSMTGIPPISPYPLPAARNSLPANLAQWTVDPQRAVLLLHDMQGYFLKPLPDPLRANLLYNTALMRKRCIDLGVQVAYTTQPGRMTDQQRGLLKDFWGPGMRTDPADREVVPELAPAEDDWIFTKWRYSALFRSDLLERMRAAGRDQLILCGVYAHVGVLATALEAFTNDIQPFLVADALGDFSEDHHQLALEYVANCCGMVVPVEEVFA